MLFLFHAPISPHRRPPPNDGAKCGTLILGVNVGIDMRLARPRSICVRTSEPRPKDSNVGGTR
jgi:hypothetical protein